MYGSDWPVCLLAGTYARVHATLEQLTAHLSPAERDLVFHDTAQRVYSLKR